MKTISSKNLIYKMSKDNNPVFFMESGERVLVQTVDCFENVYYLKDKTSLDIPPANPATGPIYLNDAKANDTLKVTIEKITLEKEGVIESVKDFGVLGKRIKNNEYKLITMDEEYAYFNDFKIKLEPMVGVIGVAPKETEISTLIPGSHGGNLDCKEIKENSVVYLPVYVDGGYLSLGDLHGLMGDGEIGYSGLETYGDVQIRVQVVKDLTINNPIVKSDNKLYFLASNENLDKAIEEASNNLVDFLVKYEKMSEVDAVRLLTIASDLGICQVVNPKKTVKLAISEEFIKNVKL